jgi:hypothetical protein
MHKPLRVLVGALPVQVLLARRIGGKTLRRRRARFHNSCNTAIKFLIELTVFLVYLFFQGDGCVWVKGLNLQLPHAFFEDKIYALLPQVWRQT